MDERTRPQRPLQRRQHERIDGSVAQSRLLILIAIAGTMVSSVAILIYSLLAVLKLIWDTFKEAEFDIDGAKHLAVELIEMTDLFLLGMVVYVVALGMYQLFVGPLNVPAWMQVRSLDELKTQLVNVIVVLLAVSFLAIAVTWTDAESIIYFGLAIAVVILSLSAFTYLHHKGESHGEREHAE